MKLSHGNYFDIEGFGCLPVVDFSCDFTGKLQHITFLTAIVFQRDRIPDQTIRTVIPELWQVNPIPLTEEWLERMGFNQYYLWDGVWGMFNEYGENRAAFAIHQYSAGQWQPGDCDGSHDVGKPFEFVHQLQNLYFALTGAELTIKP